MCISQIGPSLNGYLTQRVYNQNHELWEAFGVGTLLCIGSAVMGMVAIIIDKYSEKHDKINSKTS